MTEVPPIPSCRACRIDLHLAATLGHEADPVGFPSAGEVSIAANSRGEYVVSASTFPGEIALYDSAGAFVRLVGQQGDGPGQFRGHLLLRFDSRDSLHILQTGGGRHTVLDPQLRYARSASLGIAPVDFGLGPGGMLFSATSGVPAGPDSEDVLVVSAANGQMMAKFGETPNPTQLYMMAGDYWLVTVGPQGGLWSGRRGTGLLVDRWDLAGRRVRAYRGGPGWLRRNQLPTKRFNPTQAPPPALLAGLDFIDGRRLWVFTVVPDAHWKPMRPGTRHIDPNHIYDTMIDVIDVSTGDLLADQRFDDIVQPGGGGGGGGDLVYATESVPSGDEVIRVWNARLERPGSP